MGLFDIFNSNQRAPEMTPPMAYAISAIYMIRADGELSDEEVVPILGVLGTSQRAIQMVHEANRYAKRTKVDDFLLEASNKLDKEQKLFILAQVLDILFSDGHADQKEQQVFFSFAKSFGISQNDYQPLVQAAAIKNNKSVLFKN